VDERLLTVRELADRWSLSTATIRRHLDAGQLPVVNLNPDGQRRQVRVRLSDVETYEQGNQ
jgi:excisionase family DNA binding protein